MADGLADLGWSRRWVNDISSGLGVLQCRQDGLNSVELERG